MIGPAQAVFIRDLSNEPINYNFFCKDGSIKRSNLQILAEAILQKKIFNLCPF
jgi:hypothetical protein